jgi:hypothetical protein
MIIHIDKAEVLVPKTGYTNPFRGLEDGEAIINIHWWAEDELMYDSQFYLAIDKLGDLQPHTVSDVERADARDWYEFRYMVSREFAFRLLKDQGSVPADADLLKDCEAVK